jgi:hypothetical protein
VKKVLFIFFILLGFGLSNQFIAQTGGKKKEHRNQRRIGSLFKRKSSGGHADKFARSSKKGFFARLFRKKENHAWVYHSSKSNNKTRRENRHLFFWHRTKGRNNNEVVLAKQNSDRAKKRSRGNTSFNRKKHTR